MFNGSAIDNKYDTDIKCLGKLDALIMRSCVFKKNKGEKFINNNVNSLQFIDYNFVDMDFDDLFTNKCNVERVSFFQYL